MNKKTIPKTGKKRRRNVKGKLVFGFEYVMKSVQTFWQRPTQRRLRFIKWEMFETRNFKTHMRKKNRIEMNEKFHINIHITRRNKRAIYIGTVHSAHCTHTIHPDIQKTKNYLTSWSVDVIHSANNNMHGRIICMVFNVQNAHKIYIYIPHRHIGDMCRA